MPEHSPAPRPERGIYGFALLLTSCSLLIIYLVWALVPDIYLHNLGLTYLPDKYWAVAVPVCLCTLIVLFVLCVFAYNLVALSDSYDSIETVQHDFGELTDKKHIVIPFAQRILKKQKEKN